MARTVTEYEASDIDIDNDPLHKSLFSSLIAGIFIATAKGKEGEDKLDPSRRAVAFLLTGLERDGYVITKREDVPSPFIAPFD